MANYFSSSIGKKQVVAVTGLLLVLFLVMHLSGNLLLFKGPEAFNHYAAFLESLGNIKLAARIGLASLFIIHIAFTAMVVIENRKARGNTGYSVNRSVGNRSISTRLMPYTGTLIFLYLGFHLADYTLADHHTIKSVVNGQDLGLYGLVVNSYRNPIRVAFYVLGMVGIGFHLIHAVQSIFQTFGINHPTYTKFFKRLSLVAGLAIAIGFASIPLYFYFGCSSICLASAL
ncbi:succinate dehydrogenase [bacterium]|nr:succinate dehydrogenase [bacterium]